MKVIEWKPIKGFDGYFINELGKVRSTRSFKGTREKILRAHKNQQGYFVYTLIRYGKPYLKPLHRLLMENFKSNPNNYKCINHIDGNILNNSLDNLEWCTSSYNIKDMYKRQGKYNNDNEIINDYLIIKNCKKVATKNNMSSENVRQILIRNNIDTSRKIYS